MFYFCKKMKMPMKNLFVGILGLLLAGFSLPMKAQEVGAGLPHYGSEPLCFGSIEEWETVHRPIIYRFFEQEVYGQMPARQIPMRFEVLSEHTALNGLARMKQVAIHLQGLDEPILLLIYLPRAAKQPVPLFLAMNFKGNHQISADEQILISKNAPTGEALKNDPPRGAAASRWPLELIVGRGYGVATISRDDVDPDFDDGFRNGVHALFNRAGSEISAGNTWGTIGAWAWGLSRAMDYLEIDPDVDAKRVAVLGHSRLGKTALWAGVTDERFALVISNNSGCGGAALSSRKQGETVAAINKRFPHWFCDNYNRYSDNEAALMVDQQGLIALIAPRPVYVASAEKDLWADPQGEFLAARYASPVYELYGLKGLQQDSLPAVNNPLKGGSVGYHVRTGKHNITPYDWTQYLDFADYHFRNRNK